MTLPRHTGLDREAVARLFRELYYHRLRVPEHYAVSESPDTLTELTPYHGLALPILGEYCDRTIFYEPQVNVYQRALHDGIHLARAWATDSASELRVAREQCQLIAQHSSVLADVHYIDLVGQTMHMDTYGEFPVDQVGFVYDVLTHGRIERWRQHKIRYDKSI